MIYAKKLKKELKPFPSPQDSDRELVSEISSSSGTYKADLHVAESRAAWGQGVLRVWLEESQENMKLHCQEAPDLVLKPNLSSVGRLELPFSQ